MPLPRAIGRLSRPQALLRLSRVPSPRHFHPTSPAFFVGDDSPDDWMRRLREAKLKKDAQDAIDAPAREAAAKRRKAAELARTEREAIEAHRQRLQRRADRRIAPVVKRYTELATAIAAGMPEVAEWVRKFKELKCQREDAVRALRNTVADIRCAVSAEREWLNQEHRWLDKEREMLKDEFEDILNEIKAATKAAIVSEQLARARRAEARKTIADWKQLSHGFLTFVWSTSSALAAAANEFEKGLKQSERHRTRLERASSIIQRALSLNLPPTVRQRLVLVDDQYGNLIPAVDRLICQPRRQMQISWEAESKRFNNAALELSKAAHDLNQTVEKSRYLGFNTTEGSLRLHAVYIYNTLTEGAIDTHELIRDLCHCSANRVRDSAFQVRKEKARAALDVYRTCEKLSVRMKHLFFYMRPDFNRLSRRYTLIRSLETDDLCGMRVDRIMSLVHEASKHITSSNQLFSEYDAFSREQGYEFAPSHLAGSRRRLVAAIQAYSANWRSIRFIDVDDLRNAVSRRSEEFAKSGQLEYIRKHLVQYTEAKLRRLWESPSYFEIYDPALMPPHALQGFMEMWPEKYLDAGMDLLPGFINIVLQSMKDASPGIKGRLARRLSQYERVLWWAKRKKVPEKVPAWLEKVSREAPPLYILDKSRAEKIARLSGSRDAYFSYNLYRPAPGLELKNLPDRLSCSYHENAALDAGIIKDLRGKFIGFDMRWNQNAAPKDGPHANASLIMLATESTIDIFHLARYPTRDGQAAIAEEMITILESPAVIKVCVDAREKCNRLRNYLGVNPQGFLDLEDMHYGLQELQLDRPVPRRPLSLNDLTAEHLNYPMQDSVFDNTLDFTQPLLEPTQRLMGQSVYACVALWHAMNEKGQARQLADRMMSTRPPNESSIDAKDTGNDHPSNAARKFSQEDPSRDAEDTRAAERNGKEEEAGPAEKGTTSSSSSRIRPKARRTASTATGTRGDFWAQQKPISRPHQRRDSRGIADAAPEDDDVEGFYRSAVKAAENRGEAGASRDMTSTSASRCIESSPPSRAPDDMDARSAAAKAWARSQVKNLSLPINRRQMRRALEYYRLWHHDGIPVEVLKNNRSLVASLIMKAITIAGMPHDGRAGELLRLLPSNVVSRYQYVAEACGISTKEFDGESTEPDAQGVGGNGSIGNPVAEAASHKPSSSSSSASSSPSTGLESPSHSPPLPPPPSPALASASPAAHYSLFPNTIAAFRRVRFEKGDEGGEGTSDMMVARGVAGRKRSGKKERKGAKDNREKMTMAEFMRYMSKRE